MGVPGGAVRDGNSDDGLGDCAWAVGDGQSSCLGSEISYQFTATVLRFRRLTSVMV